jgi:hypothetical protein
LFKSRTIKKRDKNEEDNQHVPFPLNSLLSIPLFSGFLSNHRPSDEEGLPDPVLHLCALSPTVIVMEMLGSRKR